jgi:hypothetical protein
VSNKSYRNFIIRAEFWAESDTNSGIFIRCQDPNKVTAGNAYEINIWDTRPGQEYSTGAIVDIAKVNPIHKAGGRWNTMEITANGPQLKVMMNGFLLLQMLEIASFLKDPLLFSPPVASLNLGNYKLRQSKLSLGQFTGGASNKAAPFT